MAKDWVLKILYLESIDSTQTYLKKLLKEKKVKSPYAVVALEQTAGLGSRENSWIGMRGNLFLSFSIELSELPSDLQIESSSLYFAYLLKEVFYENKSNIWLKWPNDFYIENQKVGGMITNIVDNTLVCGVGINLLYAPENFKSLDIKISREKLLHSFFKKIKKKLLWKQVFSKYKLEFHKNRDFFTHVQEKKISLADVNLEEDGSILINGERIYSLR